MAFNIAVNGNNFWSGLQFVDAIAELKRAATGLDAGAIELRSGSNSWARWIKKPTHPWVMFVADRGQENLECYNININDTKMAFNIAECTQEVIDNDQNPEWMLIERAKVFQDFAATAYENLQHNPIHNELAAKQEYISWLAWVARRALFQAIGSEPESHIPAWKPGLVRA